MPPKTRATTWRWAVLAGAAVLVAGVLWDGVWHARNGRSEVGLDLVAAHGGIYLGAAIALVAAASALVDPAGRSPAFVAALAGALLAVVGHGLDFWAHETRSDARPAHALFLVGEVVLVATAVLLSPVDLRLPGARR
ncbi:MAG: hypothetical protein M3327_00660 [Actinomycetota bacterium]|nr:hypothetical protein [Actinomycetota bacterium]